MMTTTTTLEIVHDGVRYGLTVAHVGISADGRFFIADVTSTRCDDPTQVDFRVFRRAFCGGRFPADWHAFVDGQYETGHAGPREAQLMNDAITAAGLATCAQCDAGGHR